MQFEAVPDKHLLSSAVLQSSTVQSGNENTVI